MKTINLEKWRGKRDATELDPASIEFKAIAGRSGCAGCLFEGQWSSTCKKAAREAVKRFLPDCDQNVIYERVERDPRQRDMLSSENACASSTHTLY